MVAVSGPHPVAALIQQVKDQDTRWSTDADLARRAQARGFRLSKQQIGDIIHNDVKSVDSRRLHALAAALDVTPETVARAYLEAFGVKLSGVQAPGVEAAIRADTRLSSDDRETLLTVLRLARSRYRNTGD